MAACPARVHVAWRVVTSALDRLGKKTRRAAEVSLARDEHIITIIEGRSGVAALEVVVTGSERPAKADLRAAYQLPNWLPCHRQMSSSPVVGELRAFIQSGGRSNSARAALSDSDG